MKKIIHISELREVLKQDVMAGKSVGFVPTMGNLHEGHMALVSRAREENDIVVCSIFVNPLQFGANEDLDRYPRTLDADVEKLLAAGCDYLFSPQDEEMYPNGLTDQTRVACTTMTDVLCGASRPGHFDGVTTVVCKLFNIVQPHRAYFGLKDYQQLAVVRRMVSDLCMDVEVVGVPTVREEDGLAMSSRNGFISAEERPRVVVLNETLRWIAEQLQAGQRNFALLTAEGRERIAAQGFRVDYLMIVNSRTLEDAQSDDRDITLLGAMFTEAARLIDNLSVQLPSN